MMVNLCRKHASINKLKHKEKEKPVADIALFMVD